MNFTTSIQTEKPVQQPLFDEYGFLLDHSCWTQSLAEQIAVRENISELTERHWSLIEHLRNKYQTLGSMPGLRSLCRAAGIPKLDIYVLFGDCLTAWKVAGLPDPGEEIRTYI